MKDYIDETHRTCKRLEKAPKTFVGKPESKRILEVVSLILRIILN
jgi:hypothetical protein